MILKKLTIEQFGKIEHCDVLFREQVAAITVPDADGIVKAIGLATNSKSLIDCTEAFPLSVNTRIILRLKIADHPYAITARGQPHRKECAYEATDCRNNTAVDVSLLFRNMQLSEEEESLIYYRYNPKNAFSKRLFHYRDPGRYYAFGDFQKKTNGSGLTQTFRIYLKEFIQKYESCDSFADSCKTALRSDGGFIWRCADAPGSITDLNERDKKLFDYACFIDVNKFWSGFEDIRDINHEKWPMLIDAGNTSEHPDFHKLLVQSRSLGRQLIIINRQNGDTSD